MFHDQLIDVAKPCGLWTSTVVCLVYFLFVCLFVWQKGFGPSFSNFRFAVVGTNLDVVVAEQLSACSPLTDNAALSGKLVLVQRGECPFSTKVAHVAAAGICSLRACSRALAYIYKWLGGFVCVCAVGGWVYVSVRVSWWVCSCARACVFRC
jgi:hypothetical protein